MSGSYSTGGTLPPVLTQILQYITQADQASKVGEYDKEVAFLVEAVRVAQSGYMELTKAPQESVEALDHIAMNLYKHSQEALALSTTDIALALMPSYVPALHHKAVFLVAMNRDVEVAMQLLDHALALSPQDKTLWASKGDALKILGKTSEAIDSYLQAQQLDATSTQYVDRALKIQAGNPKALQMKLAISIRMGGTGEAINTCRQLIATNPRDATLNFTLANLLVNAGRYDEALKAVDMSLQSQPDNPTYLFAKARILREMERYPEAFELYRALLNQRVETSAGVLQEVAEALESKQLDQDLIIAIRMRMLELDPRNLANIQSLRAIAVARADRELSLRVYDAWLSLSPHNLEAEAALAQLFADEGDIEKALATYFEIARYHPDETRYIRKGLELAHKHRLHDRVVGFANAILAKEPNDANTMEWLGDSFAELGQWREALRIADLLLAAYPNSVAYLKRKKTCLTALGMHRDVPPIIDRIFEEDPTSYDIAMERARMYQYWAEHAPPDSEQREAWSKEALRSYERASLSPELHADCLLGMAKVFRQVHKPEKAEEAYSNFLALPGNEHRGDILKERGHVLREITRNSEALESYQKAVEAGCEDVDLLWGMAEVLRALNENARALHYLQMLIQREPRNPLYLRRYGRMLTQQGRKEEGLAQLKTALSLQDKDPTAYFEIADALKEAGMYQDALGYYQQGLGIDAKNNFALLSYIETLILTGRVPEARREIDALLRRDPSNARVWILRMEAFKFLHDDDEILYSLKAILTLSPGDAGAWEEKHRIHLARGEKDEAYEAIKSVIATTPKKADVPKLYLMQGDLASDLGKLDEALAAYEEAKKGDPKLKYEAEYRKARAYDENGQPEEAAKVLEDFGQPPFPSEVNEKLTFDILTMRGSVSFQLEHYTEALDIFEELLRKSPGNPDISLWKARTMLELGKAREAKAFLSEFLPKSPSAEAYLYLSEAESGVGSQPDAIAACVKGLQLSPSHVPLLLRLGDLWSKEEKWQEAGDAYARAVSADRNNAEAHSKIAKVHEKLGHQNEAIREYKESVRLNPEDAHAHLSLGLVFMDVGDPDEALRSIDQALKLDPDLEAAIEAKNVATQKVREKQIELYGKKALVLSAQANRPVTRNDLFMTLQVPWDLIDPVMREATKVVEVDVNKLTDKEIMDLEGMSYHLITQAMERKLSSVDRGALSLADVALLSPPEYSLAQVQRLTGYVQSVMSMPIHPETMKLSRDVEDLARKALTLPPEERTPFRLVKNLSIGIYKAMVIKAIESMTMDFQVQAPPALNYTPSPVATAPPQPVAQAPPPSTSPTYPAYEPPAYPAAPAIGGAPEALPEEPPAPANNTVTADSLSPAPPGARCAGCGGPATYMHTCGAYICRHCIVQFGSCPRCSLPLTLPTERDVSTASAPPRARPMEMPLAFMPASRRMDDQDTGENTRTNPRMRRTPNKPRRSATSTDEDAHL